MRSCPLIGRKSFYSNISYGFEHKKNCISKLSLKIFIKSKTRAGKAYAYRMLLSFKTLVAYKKISTSRWTTVFVVKQFLSDIIQFVAGHCPMSGANITT